MDEGDDNDEEDETGGDKDGLSDDERKRFRAHLKRMGHPGCFFEEPQFMVSQPFLSNSNHTRTYFFFSIDCQRPG